MSKFNVGDKVRGIQSGNNFSTYDGWISKYAPSYRDKWDDSFPHRSLREGVVGVVVAMGMHELQSYGMLYLVQRDNDKISLIGEIGIELVEQPRREFIVIRRSGAETIAELRHDREVIKSAVATCSKKDTFDFETGAKLAFDRLMGREEPKPAPAPEPKFYTGKVFAVEASGAFGVQRRVNHMFEITNGSAWEYGKKYGINEDGYTSFSNFCERCFGNEWREVKE